MIKKKKGTEATVFGRIGVARHHKNRRGAPVGVRCKHPQLGCLTWRGTSHCAWLTTPDRVEAEEKHHHHLIVPLLSHVSVVPCVMPTLAFPCPENASFLILLPSSLPVFFFQECLETRTKESNIRDWFSGVSRDTDQGVETCAQIFRESEELWFACTATRVSTGRRATALHFFCSADEGVQDVRTSFFLTRKRGSVSDQQPTGILRFRAMKR